MVIIEYKGGARKEGQDFGLTLGSSTGALASWSLF